MPEIDLSFNQQEIIIKPDRISRNSFWILLGLASSTLISFVTIFFLTRYLGPERFGIYSVAISLAALFLPLADLGFDLHMTRRISAEPSSIRQEISKTLSAKIFMAAGFWILTVLLAIILRYSFQLIFYVSLFAVSFLLGSMVQTFVGALRAIQKMKFESLSLFFGKFVGMAGMLTVILARGGMLLIILSHLAGSLVYLLTSTFLLKTLIRAYDFHFGFGDLRERIRGALPFGLTAVFVAIYYKVDTVILSKLTDDATVGIYNGAHNFIMASLMLSTPLVVSVFPVLSGIYGEKRSDADLVFNLGLKYSILIGLPLGLGAMLMAAPVIHLAYGREFVDSIVPLKILALAMPLMFATGMIGNSMGAVGYQSRVCVIAFICMIVNIVMNFILIPGSGASGAAVAKLSTEFIRLATLLVLLKGIFKTSAFLNFLKICVCCILAYLSFLVFDGIIGAWLSAAVFTIVYAVSTFILRLLKVGELREILRPSGGVS